MEQKASSGETETEREANQMFSAAASSPQDEDVSQMDSSSKKQRQESPACSATTEKQELFGVMGLDEDEIDEDVEAVLSLPDPPEIPDPEMADSLVARQMYKLSRKEREKVFCDLHGVSDATEETPEMINKAYIDLDNEIRLLMEKNRETAYETAKTMDQNFVENRKFQLAFLRADRFDSKLAALRLVRHFEAKLELFGKSNLVKEVVQDDLEKDDMEVLYDGASQILPVRDRVGRIVFLWFSSAKHNSASDKAKVSPMTKETSFVKNSSPFWNELISKEIVFQCRRMFYNGMFYSEEEETQKKGAIAVIYSIGHQQSQGYKRNPFFQMPKLLKALPLRIEGLHICYDSAFWLPAFAITRLSFPLFTRLRIRSHFGEYEKKKKVKKLFVDTIQKLPNKSSQS